MQQGFSNPEFYGDLVFKLEKIIGNPNYADPFKRIVNRFKRAGYTIECIHSFNPIIVEDYVALFCCMAVVQGGFDVNLYIVG